MNNNYSLLDLLTILSVILQMQNYEEEKKSLTNDDIAKLTYLLETKNIITKNYGY